jgi:hypothetical protein
MKLRARSRELGRIRGDLAEAFRIERDAATWAHFIVFGCLPPRSTTLYTADNSQAHVRRICLRHRPASQSRINDERLTYLMAKRNPPDSIRPELALGLGYVFPGQVRG